MTDINRIINRTDLRITSISTYDQLNIPLILSAQCHKRINFRINLHIASPITTRICAQQRFSQILNKSLLSLIFHLPHRHTVQYVYQLTFRQFSTHSIQQTIRRINRHNQNIDRLITQQSYQSRHTRRVLQFRSVRQTLIMDFIGMPDLSELRCNDPNLIITVTFSETTC